MKIPKALGNWGLQEPQPTPLTFFYMSTEAQYLTMEETAKYLNVTVRAIRNWIVEQKIEYVKMGKYVRFRKEYLDKWIEKRTVKVKKVA